MIQLTALVDFAKFGFGTRSQVAIKVDRDVRSQVEEYLCKHWNVNTIQRVNNGFSFIIDTIFKDLKEFGDFIEEMEAKFTVRNKQVFYVIEEVKREAFRSEPDTAKILGGGKDE